MANTTKLTEKTLEAFNFIKEKGGRVSTKDIQAGLNLEKIASVTGRVSSLCNKKLAVREYEEDSEGNRVCFVVLTDEGMAYNHAE
jgi:Mn-dependent DtxR family transcriptional regulator